MLWTFTITLLQIVSTNVFNVYKYNKFLVTIYQLDNMTIKMELHLKKIDKVRLKAPKMKRVV